MRLTRAEARLRAPENFERSAPAAQ